MRPSVYSAFVSFQSHFEGVCAWPYLDVKGLATVAVGLLIDPVETALGLPWVIGEYAAIESEVRQQWAALKAQPAARLASYYLPFTTIRLTPAGIQQVTLAKAAEMEIILRTYFPGYDNAPADAQLGLLSMAWALGPAFSPRWPMFTAAFRKGDWATCADQCALSTAGNPGVAPRNVACRKLFEAAVTAPDDDTLTGWP
jgi:GH24 family phage-related lysozyme (muramidase)